MVAQKLGYVHGKPTQFCSQLFGLKQSLDPAMNALAILVTVLFIFGLIVFILLFGESARFRNGIVGKAYRILTEQLPMSVIATVKRVIGEGNWRRFIRTWNYCFLKRNPFLQIFFIFITAGSTFVFVHYAMPHIPNPYLPASHRVIIPLEICAMFLSYFVACTADPGIVTKKNLEWHIKRFPYDGLLYEPKECSTCKFQKPARSKHCSLCQACVAQMDHHCAWINRCVGYNNQRYFFLFLFTLVQYCAYGAYLCFQVYRGMILEWGLDKAFVRDTRTGERTPITFGKAFLHVLHTDRIIGSVGILASVASFVVFLFLLYQLYIASRGITTNETFKWSLVEDAIDRGEIWLVNDKYESHETHAPTKGQQRTSGKAKQRKRQIKSLEEIDNIYDAGFVRNLLDVCFPRKVGT